MDENKLQADRRMVHVRRISCAAYERLDGLLDLEGTLIDTKPQGVMLPERGVIGPEEPIHEMVLRITVDRNLLIKDARAITVRSPYAVCNAINDSYRQMIGMTIGPGFIKSVKRLFRATSGCSHLTELLSPIATTAFQALFGDPDRIAKEGMPANQAALLPVDGCHALRSDGEIVRTYFPQRYQGPTRIA